MLSTALEMPKNQGLDSVSQNKKNKNKKFREKAAEGHVGIYGDAPMRKGQKIAPVTGTRCVFNMSLFVAYTRNPTKPPRGLLRGLLRGLRHPYGGGGCCCGGCCYGNGRSEAGGRGLQPVNGERARWSGRWSGGERSEIPIIPINN